MYDGTLGEIRLFAGMFAPVDWLNCDGRELPVADYELLFKALTGQSGNGTGKFLLPNIPAPIPDTRYVICVRGMYPRPRP